MPNDRFAVRTVVVLLGIIAVVGLAFMGMLALSEKAIPDAILAITSSASGGLAALLASTRAAAPEQQQGGGLR